MKILVSLTKEELAYLGQVLAARPYAEVASLIANLPAQVIAAQAPETITE